jgi:hypothetical protein
MTPAQHFQESFSCCQAKIPEKKGKIQRKRIERFAALKQSRDRHGAIASPLPHGRASARVFDPSPS